MRRVRWTEPLLLLLAGCGSGAEGSVTVDADTPDPGANIVDVVTTCPDSTALDPAGLLQRSGDGVDDLHKVTLSDPDALCNDGSPGVIFVRAAADPAVEDRWMIHLKGGGSCVDADTCRLRWCREQSPAYSAATMSSTWTADHIDVGGAFRRSSGATPNPFADWNNVFVYYCSSDSYQGRATEVSFETSDGVAYTIHFRGHSIVEAAVDALRAGVTSDDEVVSLPPLSQAAQVLLTGSSAGGVGVSRNLDYVSDRLRADGVEVRGVIDAAFTPEIEYVLDQLDPAVAEAARTALDDSSVARHQELTEIYDAFVDSSCLTENPDAPEACSETGVVQRNHITTPFMVFANLADSNLSKHYNQAGISDPIYATAIYRTLVDLPTLADTAIEGDSVTVTPGAFANACTQHTTLMSDIWFHEVLVQGVTERDALLTWLQGTDVHLVDGVDQAGMSCGSPDDTGE